MTLQERIVALSVALDALRADRTAHASTIKVLTVMRKECYTQVEKTRKAAKTCTSKI